MFQNKFMLPTNLSRVEDDPSSAERSGKFAERNDLTNVDHNDPRKSDYEIVIQPTQSWLDIDWKGIWQYRDLLLLLVKRDFLTKYKQTILGPAWFVLSPLATTFIFVIVFSKVANLSTDELPPPLFYLTGLLTWNYFSTAFNAVATSLSANSQVFSKVYFPRMLPPIAVSLSTMISVTVQFATWLVLYVIAKASSSNPDGFGLTIYCPLLIVLLIQTAMLSLGSGLIMAAVTAKYRDLSFTLSFMLQAWMYFTPVIYPLSKIPESWRWVASLNPMSAIVEASREILLGRSSLDSTMMTISITVTVALLVIGVVAFNRVQKTFVDIL